MLCTSGLVGDVVSSYNGPRGAWLWQYGRRRRVEASSQNFQCIRQGAPRCLTLSPYAVTENCAAGAKSDVYDCLVVLVTFRLQPLHQPW